MANKNKIGKTKKSTDSIIDNAITSQNDWMHRRRAFAKRFLKNLNIFARPAKASRSDDDSLRSATGLAAYWFPVLCALLVMFVAVWVIFVRIGAQPKSIVVPDIVPVVAPAAAPVVVPVAPVVAPPVPEPVVESIVKAIDKKNVDTPGFDIVRIDPSGNIVVAGRWLPKQNVSIIINKKIVATEQTDARGDFVYSPTKALKPGNYTLSLVAPDSKIESENKVFLYVSEHGYQNSISLLMTKDGSTLLQSPKLVDGDLVVSKIDYLDNGRIVVTGNALPRLRVSLTLNDKYLGFARVSDHKHFGLGGDVNKLKPGKEYALAVRLHDGDGKAVAIVEHKFKMPEMTGNDNTFYTVRRGDCLWVIARNFLRRGVLFSIIAKRNNIKNPNLVFPKQVLKIPTKI